MSDTRLAASDARAALAATGLIAIAASVWLAFSLTRPTPAPVAATASVAGPRGIANPTTADEHFAQGVHYLAGGALPAAMKEFDDAHRLQPNGRSAAYFAYCQSRSGQDRAAVGLYREAIKTHGFAPAWARNNFAYSLLRAGPTLNDLRLAEAEATAAIELSPQLRAARLNRADARFRLTLTDPKADPTNAQALADIDAVMAEPPYTAELYAKAAALTVTFSNGRPDCSARAVGYLEEAVRLGYPPKAFGSDPIFRRHLAGRPDFARLLERTAGTRDSAPLNPHLITPPLE